MKFLSIVSGLGSLLCLYIIAVSLRTGIAGSIFTADWLVDRNYDMTTQPSQFWLMVVIWLSCAIALGIFSWRNWNK